MFPAQKKFWAMNSFKKLEYMTKNVIFGGKKRQKLTFSNNAIWWVAIKNFDAAMFFGLSEAIQTFGDDWKRVLGFEPELV